MIVFHSCCPEKRDIQPPQFTKHEVTATQRGELQLWRCEGCHTQIVIAIEKDTHARTRTDDTTDARHAA